MKTLHAAVICLYAPVSGHNVCECANVATLTFRLSVLEEVLGKALERVNMDLVFLEDSEHSDLSEAAAALDSPHLLYHNTTAYVFTWLLIIEAMSQCDPEVPIHSVCVCVCV